MRCATPCGFWIRRTRRGRNRPASVFPSGRHGHAVHANAAAPWRYGWAGVIGARITLCAGALAAHAPPAPCPPLGGQGVAAGRRESRLRIANAQPLAPKRNRPSHRRGAVLIDLLPNGGDCETALSSCLQPICVSRPYFDPRRRRTTPIPSSPAPISSSEAGSGTLVCVTSLLTPLISTLPGPAVPPTQPFAPSLVHVWISSKTQMVLYVVWLGKNVSGKL